MCFAGVSMMEELQSNSSYPTTVKWKFRAQANGLQTSTALLDNKKKAKRYPGYHQKIAYGNILLIQLSLTRFLSLAV